jgi:large subunit ribosomal protein L30
MSFWESAAGRAMPHIKITQERSKIRCLKRHKRTLEALGLHRINHSVVHEDTPQIRGMVDQVAYLVRVEPVTAVEPVAAEEER